MGGWGEFSLAHPNADARQVLRDVAHNTLLFAEAPARIQAVIN
jgi:hypothetical protein